MRCVESCPVDSALYMSLAGKKKLPAWAMAAAIAAIFLGCVIYAQATGHWATILPQNVLLELVPRANEFAHP